MPSVPPIEVQDLLDRHNKDEADKKKKGTMKFPTEDTDLLAPIFKKKAADLVLRPQLTLLNPNISSEHFLYIFKVWNFVNTYGVPLEIYPFTFDDFMGSLCHHSPSPGANLMDEIFGSLLGVVCKESISRSDSTTGVNPYLSPLPTKDENGRWHEDNDLSILIDKVMSSQDQLNQSEQVAINFWYKWQPGRWLPATKKRKRSNDYGRIGAISSHPRDRLKAWPVALFGFVRDWFQDFEGGKLKWTVLNQLLGLIDGAVVEEVENIKETTAKSNISEEGTLTKSDNNELDLLGSDESELSEISASSDEDNGDSAVENYSRRPRKTVKAIADSEEDELDELDDLVMEEESFQQNRSSSKSEKPQKKQAKSTKQQPLKKKIPDMDFEDLANRMHEGFWRTSAEARIEILNFMLEVCVLESERFRNFRDKSWEKLNEANKEKRDLLKTRKAMYNLF